MLGIPISVLLDAGKTSSTCHRRTSQFSVNNDNDDILATKIICWDQTSGRSRTVPILTDPTTTTEVDGDEHDFDNDGNENCNLRHVVDPNITILAISSNTGVPATEGKILLGITYQTGRHIWLDLWWYDWWIEDDIDDQWKYHGHFPLHVHCDNVSGFLHLVDDKTWLVADTTREQLLVCHNGECIRSLQANPNRFDVAHHGSYIAWIAWGSTMWIRDMNTFWNGNDDNQDNGHGGQSQLIVRGSGEFI